jgi:hypothetical protein
MDWIKERDLLISQTMAFVQSIAVAKPEKAVARPETVVARPEKVARAKAQEALPMVAADQELPPVDKIEQAERPVEISSETSPLAPLPVAAVGMREEIQGRVAAFRAHQQLYLREREEYFHAVLDKARATGTSLPRSQRS